MIKKPTLIPHTPGVYCFKKGKTVLYIGKAGDLNSRLFSYWRKNAGQKVKLLLHEADRVEWRELESEIDALIKESQLIKNYLPKYNIVLRDDKSYFYAAITREMFPRFFISHHPEKNARLNLQNKYIGPFTSGVALKTTLRFLRKVFPYCTCLRAHKRPCLNSQIGRCPGYCCLITKHITHNTYHAEYQKNVHSIIAVLNGKKKRIIGELKQDMKQTAREQKFEKAAKIRNQIMGLENIFLHAATLEQERIFRVKRNWTSVEKTIQQILVSTRPIVRIEGYDISNISGIEAVGSMVVFINGKPAKSEYRKFRIKSVIGPNDFAMMKEVINRRLQHTEWSFPDIMIIDGGKAQLGVVLKELKNVKQETDIKAMGLAKREEELYIPGRDKAILLRTLPREVEFFFEHVRNESHRFAKKYHHKLREINYRRK